MVIQRLLGKEKRTTREVGLEAEDLAYDHLIKQGLVGVERNYSSRFGEIDLIMKDQQALVFVEVKFRQSNQFGGAAVTVTPAKQQRLIKTALQYLQQQAPDSDARFDVVAIETKRQLDNNNSLEINWIKNAFDA